MQYRMRVLFACLLLASIALVSACASDAGSKQASSSPPEQASPSEQLVRLDSQGRGELTGVELTPSTSGTALEPVQRAIERQWQAANVGVRDDAQGVGTVLMVPMWFDERTKFVETPWMRGLDSLIEAIEHPDWSWDEAGTTDVKFHLTDEVFYIDEVSMPRD